MASLSSSARASHQGTVLAGAKDSGVFQTSPGLLRRAALTPYAEGLAQYLAIRLGAGAAGRAAYRSLVRCVKSLPADELIAKPGPKAQLYRLARTIARREAARGRGAATDSAEPLAWRTAEGERGRAAVELRSALDEEASELLELRHARELTVEEIACVLGRSVSEVELALDTAEARGRRLLGPLAPDPLDPRASLYVEAFALARSWQDDAPLADPEADEGLDAGTLIGGRYEVLERVGVGAFGDVYRAQDIEVPGHLVALKVLRQPSMSESSRQSALRELKHAAAVFHPSIVQFKDHGWFEERLWFVMPWYSGETLEARMRRGAMSRAEARAIFEPLARALAALHDAGIRHQDIKPENILLAELSGEDEALLPVLIDLGVAAEEQETMLGGTPLYFAPEVAARFVSETGPQADVGPAADVFALALSLRNALEPGTQEDVAAGAVHGFVERRAHNLPPLPEARDLRYLEKTLERWLDLDPLERPTAAELAEELAVLTEPEERRARRLRIVRWLFPLLATVGLVFGGVVWALAERAEREERQAELAQQEASSARADLIVARAHEQALEEGHHQLEARFEQSRLSRHELAGELATAEGELRILRGELGTAIGESAQRAERLAELERRISAIAAQLEARELEVSELSDQRTALTERGARLERDLSAARRLADELGEERDVAQARTQALQEQLTQARTERASEHRRAEEAVAGQLEERALRAAADAELDGLRSRLSALVSALEPSAEPAEVAAPAEAAPEPSDTDIDRAP